MIELNRELLITTYGEVKLLSLTKIELSYKNITKIDSSAFKGLTKLEEIDLHRNRITEIDANCFSDLSNLKVLELSNNSLTKIDSNAFNGLKKLERLQLDENFLEEIDSTLFEPLSNLRTLSIDKNKLKTINSSTFKRLPKFHTLSLTGNEIEEIDTSLFESLSNLVYLRLGENKLKRIDENTFKNLSNLEVLTLGGDKSTVINSNHFQNISRYLRVLCLDRFKLRKIDANLFKGLKFLEVLSLDECGIEEIESNAFDDIRTLILTNNLLVRIDSDLFKRSANLEEISLSGNEIENIDQKAFEKLSKLKKLRLGDNRLKGIDREWFDDLKSIEVVELYGNDLDFCSFLSPDSYEIGFQQLLKKYEFVSDWNLFLQHLEERNRDGGNSDRLEMDAARKRVAEEGETIRQLEFEKELELLDSKESDQIDLDHENDSESESLKPLSRKRNKVKALFRACFPIKHDIKEEENDNKIEDSDEFKVGIDEIEEIKEEKDPYIGKTIYDRYEIVDKLGQFGSVYLVNDLSNIGNNKFKQKAMKVMNDFDTEIQMFFKIRHENIVEYFHSFTVFWTLIDSTTKNEWSQFGSNMDKTILITEYCENGDLKSKIDEAKRLKRGFNESDLLEWMSQAANALKFLHSQKPKPIIHRNIKPSNLLLTRRNEIKLSDLGFSDSNENDSAYMSLEVLASQFMDIKCYPNVDIWSLGCVLYELVFLKCAFPEGLYFDPPIPSNLVISGRFSNILPKMLEKDRLKRISSKRLFAELEKLISK